MTKSSEWIAQELDRIYEAVRGLSQALGSVEYYLRNQELDRVHETVGGLRHPLDSVEYALKNLRDDFREVAHHDQK